jgi:hypothetical protein
MNKSKKPIRRNQLLGPWGVGAIVPFLEDQTLMIAGLDKWSYEDPKPYIIDDLRLCKHLNVNELRWPIDFHDPKSNPTNAFYTIPAVKFPRWHYCPYCGTMKKLSYFQEKVHCDAYQWPEGKGRSCGVNDKYRRVLIPERFLVMCEFGHIDDFPVAEWLHAEFDSPYDENKCHIRRSTGGTSASLNGVNYECSCGAKRSIALANNSRLLMNAGFYCKSPKHWLGIEEDFNQKCSAQNFSLVQRGATNVWFADTFSSIYIPTVLDSNPRIKSIVEDNIELARLKYFDPSKFVELVQDLALIKNIDYETLKYAFEFRIKYESTKEVENISDQDYKYHEYLMLRDSNGSAQSNFYSVAYPIINYNQKIHPFFSRISLVSKLKETRVFRGFTRMYPPQSEEFIVDNPLSKEYISWLPAVESLGEGIFIEFNKERLKKYSKLLQNRLNLIKTKRYFLLPEQLSVEYLILHTFSHILINQLSYECGYGSSSLRERIYCGHDSSGNEMYGILVYTASGDSEGSMGGLIKQAKPGNLENTILRSIEKAKWCSSDPVCINSHGQGIDSCNLAACHNCALLPETCCETGNKFLDRGVLIGTLDNNIKGYFVNDLSND